MALSGFNKIKCAAFSAILTSTLISLSVHSAVRVDTSSLRSAVTVDGVRAHQQEFQDFADDNGGTREASSQGFIESVDFIALCHRRLRLCRNEDIS